MDLSEIQKVVDELNWKLWENNESEHKCFEIRYVTTWTGIYFQDECLWNDQDDLRKYSEKIDEYEPLDKFLIKELKKYRDSVSKILKDIK